jgi:hypothetical protein
LLSRVVLPLPRNPTIAIIGIYCFRALILVV